MRKYQSHKIVSAAPIVAAEFDQDGSGVVWTLADPETGDRTLWVVPAGFKRPNTEPSMCVDGGDYFVLYEGGYMSWSPKDVFEAGYRLVNEDAPQSIRDDDGFVHTAETSIAWRYTAMQLSRNEKYYRDIVDAIGELLGPECKTTIVGDKVAEVLRARVLEVARKRLAAPGVNPVAPTPVAKTYEVYVGSSYYPSGGHLDYRGFAENLDTALEMARQFATDETLPWWHVVHYPSRLVIVASPGAGAGYVPEKKRHADYREEAAVEG